MRRSLFSVVLVLLLLCAASSLHGQTFNLQTGREAVASIRESIVSAAQSFGKQADDQTILLIRRME